MAGIDLRHWVLPLRVGQPLVAGTDPLRVRSHPRAAWRPAVIALLREVHHRPRVASMRLRPEAAGLPLAVAIFRRREGDDLPGAAGTLRRREGDLPRAAAVFLRLGAHAAPREGTRRRLAGPRETL